MTARVKDAIRFLRLSGLDSLPTGRVAIEGERIFAIVSSYTTRPWDESTELEAHRKYIDMQFLLAGREVIGWASADGLPVNRGYDEVTDFWTGSCPLERVTLLRLAAGQVAVLYPSDAHVSQLEDVQPMQVRKVVVKIALA
jgi:YhcH/YjgK/YiaL family protein